MYYLGIHKSLHHVLTHSASLDVFASHVFEDIHSARESRQVLHTLSQRWIAGIEVHAVDVDERECIAAIGLKLIQDIATIQVDVDDALLVKLCHEAGIVSCQGVVKLLDVIELFGDRVAIIHS